MLSAKYKRFEYIKVDQGEYFGLIDIFASLICYDLVDFDNWHLENWIRYSDRLERIFTVTTSMKN